MNKPQEITNLQRLLNSLREAGGDSETLSVDDIRSHFGRRAFGPLLTIAALPSLTPFATVPGLPTTLAVIILLTAGQMLAGMRQVWLPKRILRQSIPRQRMNTVINYALPVARFLDRFIRPRLVFLTQEPATYVMAIICCLLALTMPPLELIPFTGGIPAFPVLLFGLAMTARDGALAIVGLIVVAIAVGSVIFLGTRLF